MDPELDAAVAEAGGADEQAWLADPELAGESVFQHVGAGLLLGDGLLKSPDGGPQIERIGRNLLTEAEHATSIRHARDLMDRAAVEPEPETADEVARSRADGPGVQYLRDNSDKLLTGLASKQAKAAQVLLDTYGEMGRLKPERRQLESSIADKKFEQAQWLTHARKRAELALDPLPESLAKPLRKQVTELGLSGSPVDWFEQASELSDQLTRAKAKATRAAKAADGVDASAHQAALDSAQRILRAGLGDETLWGSAAATETSRASGYERRVDDHWGAFEGLFTTRLGGKDKADPTAFLRVLQSDDPEAREALRNTLEAARTTAGAASRFGRSDEAKRILDAVDSLEATGSQARAVQAALRGAAPLDRSAVEAEAMEALSGAPGAGDARPGVFRAVRSFIAATEQGSRRAASELLQPRGPRSSSAALQIAAPGAPSVTLANFDAVRGHMQKLTEDPRYFGEVVGASFGQLPQAAPEVFAAISAQTAKAANYLVATAPGGTSGGPFAERYPVSEDELWEFNQRFAAVTDPEHVRRELRAGSLSSQSVEAFQAVHERQYMRLQMDVFAHLKQLHDDGIPVPSSAREQLDVLLDLDGGGDPAMTWQVAERAEAAHEAHKQRMTMPKPGGDTGAMQSTALSTLGNGAAKA